MESGAIPTKNIMSIKMWFLGHRPPSILFQSNFPPYRRFWESLLSLSIYNPPIRWHIKVLWSSTTLWFCNLFCTFPQLAWNLSKDYSLMMFIKASSLCINWRYYQWDFAGSGWNNFPYYLQIALKQKTWPDSGMRVILITSGEKLQHGHCKRN